MKQVAILTTILVTVSGCSSTNNPVSPITDTINSDNLQVTFSIPRPSYGMHDTLTATTTAYNPESDTVSFVVPCCWPILWYLVRDSSGTTRLSYSAPKDLGCNCAAEFSIPPHQSERVPLLDVIVPIGELGKTENAQGSYILTVDNIFGTFSLRFAVN